MKKCTILDLRHYQHRKPEDGMPKEEIEMLKAAQPPTSYGLVSTICTAMLLKKMGIQPDRLVCSPQPRASTMLNMIKTNARWTSCWIKTLPALNDLSSDPNFDIERLKKEAEDAKQSTELTALKEEWSRMYLFVRSNDAFRDLGQMILAIDNDNPVIIIVSHGAAVEMRYLRMKLLASGEHQTPDTIKADDIDGGMFDPCEGGVYHDVEIDESGNIVGCGKVETFRLPTEVKALKEIFS